LYLSVLLFQVRAEPLGCHFNLKSFLPITVGTIPLRQGTVPQEPLPFGAQQQSDSAPSRPPPYTETSFAPPFPYPDIRRFHQLVIYIYIYPCTLRAKIGI
jgi:hypothetical protein